MPVLCVKRRMSFQSSAICNTLTWRHPGSQSSESSRKKMMAKACSSAQLCHWGHDIPMINSYDLHHYRNIIWEHHMGTSYGNIMGILIVNSWTCHHHQNIMGRSSMDFEWMWIFPMISHQSVVHYPLVHWCNWTNLPALSLWRSPAAVLKNDR